GSYDNAAELAATTPTLAHYLRAAGYQTALAGKMHFIGPDPLHGFEERLTPEIYSADLMTLPDWSDPSVDEFASDASEALEKAGPAPRTVQIDYDEQVFAAARQKIFDLARSDDLRPFFLAASFTHPHDPYICQPGDWDLYESVEIDRPHMTRAPKEGRDTHTSRIYDHYNLDSRKITLDLVENARRAFYGSLSYADRLLGGLLDALQDAGLADNTIVILTSDHGDMLGERGMWFKKVFFDNAVRIPLMISYPGIQSRRVTDVVSLVDLLPTFLDIAGTEAVGRLDGHSLMPFVMGDASEHPGIAYAEITCEGVPEPVVMVRTGEYKLIYSAEAEPLLYDMVNDPFETKNRAADPEYGEVLTTLVAHVEATWGSLPELKTRILESQKIRAFVADALSRGKFHSWDSHDPAGGGERYLRRGKSYNAWNYSGLDAFGSKPPSGPKLNESA
ncbi:MAG: choline-sulfatase, partial [Parvularcula sp.]|nr:choline-sulfatase [Parvularcula sp.]